MNDDSARACRGMVESCEETGGVVAYSQFTPAPSRVELEATRFTDGDITFSFFFFLRHIMTMTMMTNAPIPPTMPPNTAE